MRRLAALFALLLVAPLAADVAVRQNGMRFDGELRLTKSGTLVFEPQKRDAKTDDVIEYRFDANPPPFRAAPGMLLSLAGEQRLSVVLKAIDKNVVVRTAWADRLELPRDAVVSLTHLPGRQPVFSDDLAGKLTAWATKGEPKVESSALVLKTPGQSVTYALDDPLAEGRVGVNLLEQDSPAGARWVVEAAFARKVNDRTVRVTLGGVHLAFDSGGLDGNHFDVERSRQLRRLFIDFSRGSLRVAVDDEVLWYTLDAGPGGPLKAVRLACVESKKQQASGSVAFSGFAVERSVPQRRHPAGDSRQDELWLADGDQLFGKLVRADATEAEIEGRFGKKRYAWKQLHGWFARRTDKAVAAKSPVVRVGIRGGLHAEHDLLEGTLTALTAREVKLRHPSLGELTLPRDRVAWLRPVVK